MAGEPLSERKRHGTHCHHLNQVLKAAIGLTTGQPAGAAKHADRLAAD